MDAEIVKNTLSQFCEELNLRESSNKISSDFNKNSIPISSEENLNIND